MYIICVKFVIATSLQSGSFQPITQAKKCDNVTAYVGCTWCLHEHSKDDDVADALPHRRIIYVVLSKIATQLRDGPLASVTHLILVCCIARAD